MAGKGTVNNVNVDQLFNTIDAIKDQPKIARFVFRTSNKWIKGGHNRSTIKGFFGACEEQTHDDPFVLDNGEHPVLLSEDEGANPVEYALHALAGCLTTSFVYHAAAKGIRIDEVESEVEGDLDLRGFLGMDESVRNGFEGIRITFRVKGDATDEQLEELIQVAQQRSPVYDIVTNPVPVSVRLEKS